MPNCIHTKIYSYIYIMVYTKLLVLGNNFIELIFWCETATYYYHFIQQQKEKKTEIIKTKYIQLI